MVKVQKNIFIHYIYFVNQYNSCELSYRMICYTGTLYKTMKKVNRSHTFSNEYYEDNIFINFMTSVIQIKILSSIKQTAWLDIFSNAIHKKH